MDCGETVSQHRTEADCGETVSQHHTEADYGETVSQHHTKADCGETGTESNTQLQISGKHSRSQNVCRITYVWSSKHYKVRSKTMYSLRKYNTHVHAGDNAVNCYDNSYMLSSQYVNSPQFLHGCLQSS